MEVDLGEEVGRKYDSDNVMSEYNNQNDRVCCNSELIVVVVFFASSSSFSPCVSSDETLKPSLLNPLFPVPNSNLSNNLKVSKIGSIKLKISKPILNFFLFWIFNFLIPIVKVIKLINRIKVEFIPILNNKFEIGDNNNKFDSKKINFDLIKLNIELDSFEVVLDDNSKVESGNFNLLVVDIVFKPCVWWCSASVPCCRWKGYGREKVRVCCCF